MSDLLIARNLFRGRVYSFARQNVPMVAQIEAMGVEGKVVEVRVIDTKFVVQANGDLAELECRTLDESPVSFGLPRMDTNLVVNHSDF